MATVKIELNEQIHRLQQNFYDPDWWDGWLKKNLNRKVRLLRKLK
jgi:hypothetical protein